MRFLLRYLIFVPLLSVLIASQISAQSPEAIQLRKEVDALVRQLVDTHTSLRIMSQQADGLAGKIKQAKASRPSALNDRSLESALRESQVLADSLQFHQVREQGQSRTLRQKAEQLLKYLNGEIERLVAEGTLAKKQRDENRRKQISTALQTYRQWQKECGQILEVPPPSILIFEVQVDPQDDAAELRRKADFLRDQADRLEREIDRIDKKLKDLKTEAALRERMNEFATDLSLFEPSNEGIKSASGQPSLGTRSEDAGPAFSDVANKSGSEDAFISTLSWPQKIGELSSKDLQDWQKRLQQLRQRRKVQADSLKQRAEEVEKLGQARKQ